ncbi:MAG TPA: anti-sigma factor antagonist [Vicinamibacterales bacterium]|jgi:anti-sigma B factor antagonist
MSLSLTSRRVGDVTVVTCSGRIVAGAESESLQKSLDELLTFSPHILLHLGGVDFIDSAGLGLLARYLTRVQNASGTLKICAVSPKIDDVLRITRLKAVFQPYETEADPITEVHRRVRLKPDTTGSLASDALSNPDVLCVDESDDVLAYLRELLKRAGYRAITAANLPDALILLKATGPKVVVISAALRAARSTRAAVEFHKSAESLSMIELLPDFSAHDAGDAGTQVLDAVRQTLPLARG